MNLTSIPVKQIQLEPKNLTNSSTCITEVNKRYAVVKAGGKVVVVDELSESIDLLSFRDFENLYNNIKVVVGKKECSLGKYWLNHKDRRQYLDGIVFDPSTLNTPGRYNLWAGFAVDPDSTNSCNAFLEHLKNVICSGNDDHNEYVLNWLAMLVQVPGELPQVAIGLLSDQGTGKGLLLQYLGRIFGRHYKHITDKSHLVGGFSGHLHDAVLIFADELSWNRNKAEEGILKALITEPRRMMEKKFADAIQVKNCSHLIIASNSEWAIPTEMSDRRFCVFKVSNCKRGNQPYFNNLVDEMKNGGPNGLLHQLQNRDISSFNPTKFPKTSARTDQQLSSLNPIEQWLFHVLQVGSLSTDTESDNEHWPDKLNKSLVYEDFCNWFGRQRLNTCLPPLGSFTSTIKKYGIHATRCPINTAGTRPQGYRFPELEIARQNFEKALGSNWEWEDSE